MDIAVAHYFSASGPTNRGETYAHLMREQAMIGTIFKRVKIDGHVYATVGFLSDHFL
jgi:hypothetical protein